MRKYFIYLALLLIAPFSAAAATECHKATILSPMPFMGNNDEVFKLDDGSLWQVKFEYEYLYEYMPSVIICPSQGKLLVSGKTLSVIPINASRRANSSGSMMVVFKRFGCDYFIADGPKGYYILEWYGGYDPSQGDTFAGDVNGYGFKNVIYLKNGQSGRVYVEDYLLSRGSALEKIAEKCQ